MKPGSSSQTVSYTGEKRRAQKDRRETPTRIWDSLLGFYRRKKGRRVGERDNIYVDFYSRHDLLLTVGVLMLNILDAFFTLRWLGMGGGESNPLMELLIRANDMLFLFEKCVVVGIWLIVLVIHKNFRIARLGLWGAFILYSGILLYHFALQAGAPPVQRLPVNSGTGLRHEKSAEPQAASSWSRIPSSSARSPIW